MFRKGFVLLAAGVAAGVVGVTVAWAGFPNILGFGDATIVYGAGDSSSAARMSGGGGGDFSDPRVQIEDIEIADVDYSHVVVTVNGRFDAEYVCVKRGRVVRGSAKKVLVDRLKASAEFAANPDGEAAGSVLTGPLPSPASTGFTCPAGQTLEFDRAVFSELVLAAQGGEKVKLHTTLASESVHGLP